MLITLPSPVAQFAVLIQNIIPMILTIRAYFHAQMDIMLIIVLRDVLSNVHKLLLNMQMIRLISVFLFALSLLTILGNWE